VVTDPFANTPNPFEDDTPITVEEVTPQAFNVDPWAFTKEPWADTIDSFDVAKILGTTVNNVRQLTFRGTLTVVGRKNRRALYAKTQVEQYLNRNVTNKV